MICFCVGDSFGIAEQFVQFHDADVTICDHYNVSPLMWAATHGNVNMINLILSPFEGRKHFHKSYFGYDGVTSFLFLCYQIINLVSNLNILKFQI